MNPQDTTNRLVRGSHAIDRMKKEVQETVSILIGYVAQFAGSERPVSEEKVFESASCRWLIGYHRPSRPHQIRIVCWVKKKPGDIFAFSSYEDDVILKTIYVQRVYENLDVLVGGLVETFPQLEALMQPLVSASYVNFET